jgi:hypothetical protein
MKCLLIHCLSIKTYTYPLPQRVRNPCPGTIGAQPGILIVGRGVSLVDGSAFIWPAACLLLSRRRSKAFGRIGWSVLAIVTMGSGIGRMRRGGRAADKVVSAAPALSFVAGTVRGDEAAKSNDLRSAAPAAAEKISHASLGAAGVQRTGLQLEPRDACADALHHGVAVATTLPAHGAVLDGGEGLVHGVGTAAESETGDDRAIQKAAQAAADAALAAALTVRMLAHVAAAAEASCAAAEGSDARGFEAR